MMLEVKVMTKTMKLYYCDHYHLVTTLIYEKETINLKVIISTLFYHSQMRQNVKEETRGEGRYVHNMLFKGIF